MVYLPLLLYLLQPMGYSADQPARSGTQGHSVPKPGFWRGRTVRPLALVGFKLPALKCKWQVLAPLCLSEPPPGSFMRLQALSSQLWPRFPPSQQGSKDRQRGENKKRRLMRGRGPAGQGYLACASSCRVPLSRGG